MFLKKYEKKKNHKIRVTVCLIFQVELFTGSVPIRRIENNCIIIFIFFFS